MSSNIMQKLILLVVVIATSSGEVFEQEIEAGQQEKIEQRNGFQGSFQQTTFQQQGGIKKQGGQRQQGGYQGGLQGGLQGGIQGQGGFQQGGYQQGGLQQGSFQPAGFQQVGCGIGGLPPYNTGIVPPYQTGAIPPYFQGVFPVPGTGLCSCPPGLFNNHGPLHELPHHELSHHELPHHELPHHELGFSSTVAEKVSKTELPYGEKVVKETTEIVNERPYGRHAHHGGGY